MIEIDNITHGFSNKKTGIKNINIRITKGEFVIIAGINGSGKTTLLKHLNGLLKPDSGKISFNGINIKKNINLVRQKIGFIFQNSGSQIIGETVFEDIIFGLENLKLKRNEINEKALSAMEIMDLANLAETPVHSLSGGQVKRLAIASVLAMEPDVILFDEPFANLDYPSSKDLINHMEKLSLSGKTIIVSSHDIEKIIHLSKRLIIMENGEIKEDNRPEKLMPVVENYGIKEPCSSKFGKGIIPWVN